MTRAKPTVIGICSGAVAGLVAITPASGFVGPVGAFAGVFAVEQYGGTAGLIEGNGLQVVSQFVRVSIVLVYDAVVMLVILLALKVTIGLRVNEEGEREGLDQALHGETVQ
jgi:ammonium transporter, Amt family